jgi:hypothetical protein
VTPDELKQVEAEDRVRSLAADVQQSRADMDIGGVQDSLRLIAERYDGMTDVACPRKAHKYRTKVRVYRLAVWIMQRRAASLARGTAALWFTVAWTMVPLFGSILYLLLDKLFVAPFFPCRCPKEEETKP